MSEPQSGTRLLGDVFWRLRRRVLWIASCSGLGWAVVLGALSVLVGIWLDLLIELSPSVRIGALVSALLIASGAIVALVRQGLRAHQLRRLARQLDDVIGSGGEIGSGVDLAGLANEGRRYETSTLTAGLSALAVARAATLATSVSPTRVISSKPVRRSLGTCVALSAAVILLVLALPRLARTEWLRFIDPFGDHPPYSRLTFNVTPGNTRVVYGQGMDIQVDVDGPAPDRLQLVVVRESLTKSAAPEHETFPMFPEADRTWRASIMQVTEPLRYFVRSGNVRSHQFAVQVITVPRIEEVRFRITWPEYTRRATYDGPLPREGLSGLPGTRVDVMTRSNRPLAEGTLRLFAKSGELTIALRPNAGNDSEVSGSFTIRETGRIEIRVTDTQRQASTDLFMAPVTVLPDNRPFVRLLEPRSVSFATPDAILPVVIAAEDDFGLCAAELFRNLNDSPYRSMSLDIPSPPPTRINDEVLLPLRDFGLEPGDEIKLFARVTDNDPTTAVDLSSVGQSATATGKGAESAIAVIRIISVEEFQRLRQTQDSLDSLLSKYQQAERRAESLLEEIEALRETLDKEPVDAKLNDEHRRKLAELSERLTQETEALQKLAKSELPFELDRELRPALQRLAQSVEAAAKEMPEMTKGSPCAACSGALKKMADALRRGKSEFHETTNPPLELLSAVYPLMEDEGRFVQIYERQRDLAERLASLRDKDQVDDPALRARLRDLESEQRQLRDELGEILDDIEGHVAQLPDDPRFDPLRQTATEFAKALRASGANAAMSYAEQGLGGFSGSRGHEGAKRAADILETFLSKCQGMGQSGGQCLPKFQPKLSQCLSNTISQLLSMSGFGSGGDGGFGQGAGNGFSARRNSLQNVGLYGSQPSLVSGPSSTGTGSSNAAGKASRDAHSLRDRPDGEGLSLPKRLHSIGSSDATVPPRYRQQVGRYFQRLADELGD